jgi:hypothetical protein
VAGSNSCETMNVVQMVMVMVNLVPGKMVAKLSCVNVVVIRSVLINVRICFAACAQVSSGSPDMHSGSRKVHAWPSARGTRLQLCIVCTLEHQLMCVAAEERQENSTALLMQ